MVKNVTGYDVAKLMAGSFGTLAALTELTVKVLQPPVIGSLGIWGAQIANLRQRQRIGWICRLHVERC